MEDRKTFNLVQQNLEEKTLIYVDDREKKNHENSYLREDTI